MKSAQVATWRKYTAAQKRAYQDRLRSRRWRGAIDQQFAELARLQARREALRGLRQMLPSTPVRNGVIVDTGRIG